MICNKCNYENPDSAKYCCNCGEHLVRTIVCPKCKNEIPKDSKFCPDCGCKIQDLECLREEVRMLISNNISAYNQLVNDNVVPRFVYRDSTFDVCDVILSKSNEIIKLQTKIDGAWRELKRKEEEQQRKAAEEERKKVEEQKRKEEEKERQEREIEVLKEKAIAISEQCKPSRTGYVLTSIFIGVIFYIWLCFVQPYEVEKNIMVSILCPFIIYVFLTQLLFSPARIYWKNIEKWKESHPNDPLCHYLPHSYSGWDI